MEACCTLTGNTTSVASSAYSGNHSRYGCGGRCAILAGSVRLGSVAMGHLVAFERLQSETEALVCPVSKCLISMDAS